MHASDCVDTALTRARQARLPSPWTGRWKSRERENATCSATEPDLRAEPLGEAQKSLRGAHGERSERLEMHASDCTQRSRRRSELRSLFYDAACADSLAAAGQASPTGVRAASRASD